MISFVRKVFFRLVQVGNFLVPKNRKQVLLHSYPDIENQIVAILRWFRENPKSMFRVVVLTSGEESVVREYLRAVVGDFVDQIIILKKVRLVAILAYCRSGFIFITHGLYGYLSVPRRQCVVNLWHGMPLKSIWKSLGVADIPKCTWLLSTSTTYSQIMSNVSGFPVEKIPALGLPCNDLLFSDTPEVKKFIKNAADGVEKVILFLPTYRKSNTGYITHDGKESASALAMNESEYEALQKFLATKRVRLLVKPHPMSVHYGDNKIITNNIWLINDEWLLKRGVTLYEVLGRMDALITDASSVYVDFLCIRKPIFFYFPDYEIYCRTRRFLFDPLESVLAGPMCQSGESLIAALEDWCSGEDSFNLERERMATLLNPQSSSNATNKLFEFLGISVRSCI